MKRHRTKITKEAPERLLCSCSNYQKVIAVDHDHQKLVQIARDHRFPVERKS